MDTNESDSKMTDMEQDAERVAECNEDEKSQQDEVVVESAGAPAENLLDDAALESDRNVAVEDGLDDDRDAVSGRDASPPEGDATDVPTTGEIHAHDWDSEVAGTLPVFYSGFQTDGQTGETVHVKEIAQNFAAEKNSRCDSLEDIRAITIHDTEIGRRLDEAQANGHLTRDEANDLWKAASAQYAEAAKNNEQALGITPIGFVATADDGRTFAQVEHPSLHSVFTDETQVHARYEKLPDYPVDRHGSPVQQ